MAPNMCIPAKRTSQHSHVEAILPRLRRHAVMLAGSRQRADDSVTACLRAYRRQPSQVRAGHAETDLFRLFHSIIDVTVQRAQASGSKGCAESRLHLVVDGASDRGVDTTMEPLRLLDGLSPAQRRVMTLVTVEGFTLREAADILDMMVDEVRILLTSARNALRAAQTKPQGSLTRKIKEA